MSNESDSRVLQKKPSESAFKQQKLPAWQPILTAGTVLPTFFVIGIAFIPIGVIIVFFNNGIREMPIPYTDCVNKNNESCADIIGDRRDKSCNCIIPFSLDEDYLGDVFLYYELTNFYQNHRRYVKSRSDIQLLGKLDTPSTDECQPYLIDPNTSKIIAPCGAIANSMFSDVLRLEYKTKDNKNIDVPLLRTGIAWPSDKEIKFKNPEGNLEEAFKNYAKPRDWKKPVYELDLEDPNNNGFQNEDFIVWMRTAALPNFRKLYRRLNRTALFDEGLKKGDYFLHVEYNYPVKPFKGTKSLIISTTSILGAKNSFLGYAYIVVGCLCLIVGVIFLIIHIKYGKNTAEVVNVTPTTSYQ